MSEHTQPNTATLPAEICGCTVDCALSEENHTYLAIGPGGRGVVIKRLDPDCLWNGSLHPGVKERLARVRELAHPGIANLLAVIKEADGAYLMWEYIEGVPLDEYLADRARSVREVATLARELILAVGLLHSQGIVHGAIVAGNVIVTPGGAVRLTHVSPLLYTDYAVDNDCVISLLAQIVEERGEADGEMGQLIAEARDQKMDLRVLGVRLANFVDSRGTVAQRPAAGPIVGPRRRALYGAAAVALLGIALACGVWYVLGHATPLMDALTSKPGQSAGR
ncbi:MAG TPA: protein kinase [Humisphaera sp.]|nr:protein kinase [Humisphaera sp.]